MKRNRLFGNTAALALLAAGMFALAVPSARAAEQSAEDPVPTEEITSALKGMGHAPFPIGKPNSGYAKYFTGKSYLAPLAGGAGLNVANAHPLTHFDFPPIAAAFSINFLREVSHALGYCAGTR